MIERVYLLFEIVSIILVLWILHGSKKRPGICTIIYVCLELIIVSLIGEGWISNYYFSLAYLGLVVVDIFEFNDNLKNSIIYIVTDYFLIFCCQLIGAVIFAVVFHNENMTILGEIIINAIMLVVLFGVFLRCRLDIILKQFLEKDKIANILLALCGIILAAFLKMQMIELALNWDLIVYSMLFFSITILVVLKLERERIQKTRYLEELQQYQQYNIVYKDIISEIRHRQHDFNNHLQALYSMSMACDTLEELRDEECDYLKRLEENGSAYHLLSEKASSILVAFLYVKFKDIEENNITLEYKVNVDKVDKIIPFSDIVELIGNLLDNAAEAVLKNEVKKICFLLEERTDMLHLKISNAYNWNEKDKLPFKIQDGKSEKGSGHGYGLSNVKRIVEMYKGILQIECTIEENLKMISFDILLPLKKEIS